MNTQEKDIQDLSEVILATDLLQKKMEEIVKVKDERIDYLADIIMRLLKGETL